MNIARTRKYRADNIMSIALTRFFEYIMEMIKRNSKEKIFLKKFRYHHINISRVYFERLYKKKLVDIFKEFKIRLIGYSDEYYNRKIIEKIYEEKKEINVIKIL